MKKLVKLGILCASIVAINSVQAVSVVAKVKMATQLIGTAEKLSARADQLRKRLASDMQDFKNFDKQLQEDLQRRKIIYNLNIQEITNKQIRQILKRLKYNKYYENIPNIINYITGKKAPIITREYEELLRNMFKEIQGPFINNCPEERKNFLSYSYVLHKFCELLEYDHLLEYFSLLKSREKLHQQDLIWSQICKDLNWEFIPESIILQSLN